MGNNRRIMSETVNAVDIAGNFVDRLSDYLLDTNIQIIGGVGSAALGHSGVEILPEERLIVVRDEIVLPRYRDDGTLRDLDVLVTSADPDDLKEIEEVAEETIDEGDLEVSIFNYQPMSKLEDQVRNPALAAALVHVSDRYVEQKGTQVRAAKKPVFPFAVDVPTEALETWGLKIGNHPVQFPVPHPGATILNYLTRSSSGLRPKDAKKVHAMTANISDKAPETIDWIIDGPGASQLELARVLHTLREGRNTDRPLHVGNVFDVEQLDLGSLAIHPAFMLIGHPAVRQALIEAEHAKSAAMFAMEKRPRVVTAWQRYVEPSIGRIVKNS